VGRLAYPSLTIKLATTDWTRVVAVLAARADLGLADISAGHPLAGPERLALEDPISLGASNGARPSPGRNARLASLIRQMSVRPARCS
jgi:hypothetical protein